MVMAGLRRGIPRLVWVAVMAVRVVRRRVRRRRTRAVVMVVVVVVARPAATVVPAVQRAPQRATRRAVMVVTVPASSLAVTVAPAGQLCPLLVAQPVVRAVTAVAAPIAPGWAVWVVRPRCLVGVRLPLAERAAMVVIPITGLPGTPVLAGLRSIRVPGRRVAATAGPVVSRRRAGPAVMVVPVGRPQQARAGPSGGAVVMVVMAPRVPAMAVTAA